ncbi:hypothetical protein [Sphingomonas alpina]|uniref:YkuD domain-containing protein n=1 Tax=Sphingomonas alpina TaxID=653931 RepID=A0A7H0LMY4_9SPHN|nr:hypothetical protein [Sphingomonas alpina]QNQ11037.1 hypothetical protein H3Z74_07705 [Sphingomonas alpina]
MARPIRIVVGGTVVGSSLTWAYPKGDLLGNFRIPTYRMTVSGTDAAGRPKAVAFEVLRFGVQSKDGRSAQVVGLADAQTHTIKQWIPTYRVHSARSLENGGWQVYANFLIHDGPDNATELFASIGCVEVMGRQGFVAFNDLLIELAGVTGRSRDDQLHAIARSGKLSIHYERASRPPLVKA